MYDALERLKSAIARSPLVLAADTRVLDAVVQMSGQSKDPGDEDSANEDALSTATGRDCVVVVDREKTIGIFTERDVIGAIARGLSLERLTLRHACSHPPISIQESELTDFVTVQNLFQYHQISHLLVLDKTDRLSGIVTRGGLQEAQARELGWAEIILASQHQVLEGISQANPPSHIFDALLRVLEAHLPNTKCIILSCQDGFLEGAIAPSLPPDFVETLVLPIAGGAGACVTAAYRREVAVALELDSDPLYQYGQHFSPACSLQSCWGIPILAGDRSLLGVLGIYWQDKRSPQLQEIQDARKIANLVRAVIAHSQKTQALQAREERWQLVLDGSRLGVWDWDVRNNTRFYSHSWKQSRGYQDDEISDSPEECFERVHPDDRDRAMAMATTLLSGEAEFFEIEYRSRCKNGSYIWILDRGQVLRNKAGQVVRILGSDTDITDRKIAELALQDSERRYASLAAAAPVAMFRLDKSLRCVYANDRWSEMTGRPVEAALGGGWLDPLHPSDRGEAMTKWTEICSNLSDCFPVSSGTEGRLLQPNGTVKWFYVRVAQELDDEGNVGGYIGTLTDITERKEAELALQDAQAQFHRMTENVPGMIYRYVLHADGSDEMTYVSPQIQEIYELEPEAVLQSTAHLWERVHPDDIPWLQDSVRDSAKTLQAFKVEHRLSLPQKGLRWIQAFAYPERLDNGDVMWDGVVIDISDRKQTELALEQEILRRNTIFNASSDGIHILDVKGNLLEANAGFFRMLGYTPAEARQLDVGDWDARWSKQELQTRFQSYSWELAKVWSVETLHRRKDGSIFPVEISACFMEWNGERSMVCISRDITARRQAEAQLRKTNVELARATRLKDEFLANMSHELRTPLNAILGLTEVLQDETFGPINVKQLEFLQTIERSGSHLLELINDILDLAKIEAGQIELGYSSIVVAHLCESSVAFVRQLSLEKNIQLHWDIEPDLPNIEVDERRIRQVLINLLNNAVKFTPEAGRVVLKAISFSPDESEKTYLRLAVTDTGIGIAPENLEQLFHPFVQLDSSLHRQYKGTGLGLALVKQIVELHGGHVAVTSEVGVGSCFTVDLPYLTSISNSPVTEFAWQLASAPSERKESISHPLILLAEDNEANISTLRNYLQAKGYRVEVAKNGEAAIESTREKRPNIILMDVQMPKMDGLTAIRHIRRFPDLQQIPIIALTASAMKGDRENCLEAGATMYLSKPVRLKHLVRAIEDLLY